MGNQGVKVCKKCGEGKPLTDYNVHKRLGYHPRCKTCRREDHKIYYRANRDKFIAYKARARGETVEERTARIQKRRDEAPAKRKLTKWKVHIWNTLGVTPEVYDGLYIAQGGKCAICKDTHPGAKRERFCIDHCHTTGVIRGLLCIRCNYGLGYFKDDPKMLSKAAKYLRKHKC